MPDKESRQMHTEFEHNQPTDLDLEAQLSALSSTIEPEADFITALEQQLLDAHAGPEKMDNHPAIRLFQFPADYARRSQWTAAVGVLLAALVLLMASPTTRASILGLLNGFALIEEEALSTDTVEITEPIVPDGSYSFTKIDALVEQAFRPVAVPSLLPAELTFTSGWIDEDAAINHIEVTQIYHFAGQTVTPESSYLLISFGTDSSVITVLPREHAQWEQVDGQEALFVQGRWRGDVSGRNGDSLENIGWDATADALWLSWSADDLNMLIVADGLGFERDEIVDMAESLVWR